jgi:predicted RNase H-like HicB family nuclease
MAKYTIIIEKGDRNYSAYCPDIPGVVAAGETEEETEELIKEAIELHLDGLKEENLPIPEPTTRARSV